MMATYRAKVRRKKKRKRKERPIKEKEKDWRKTPEQKKNLRRKKHSVPDINGERRMGAHISEKEDGEENESWEKKSCWTRSEYDHDKEETRR